MKLVVRVSAKLLNEDPSIPAQAKDNLFLNFVDEVEGVVDITSMIRAGDNGRVWVSFGKVGSYPLFRKDLTIVVQTYVE